MATREEAKAARFQSWRTHASGGLKSALPASECHAESRLISPCADLKRLIPEGNLLAR